MKWNSIALTLTLFSTLMLWPTRAAADGLLLSDHTMVQPERTLVDVQVYEQVATTVAELEFPCCTGPGKQFLFPVPPSASVVGFSLYQDGAWQDAQISPEAPPSAGEVSSTPAAQAYPQLESYLGSNGFAIDLPNASESEPTRVRVEYLQILPYEFGEITYSYPLQSEPVLAEAPRKELLLRMNVTSVRALAGYSAPGYAPLATVESRNDTSVTVAYHGTDLAPPGPFDFSYGVVQEGDLYVHLLTHHVRCPQDGYFLLIVEPRHDVSEAQAIPKSFSFVIDRSGSMDGYKMAQARDAGAFFIQNLNAQDWFNVVSFNEYVDALFAAPQPVSGITLEQGLGFVNQQYAAGNTNLLDAMLTALAAPLQEEYARIVVLLTDGQPTAGETVPSAILQRVQAANASSARIFAFGIGHDVNEPLLTALATGNRGEAHFLGEHDDIAAQLSGFFAKVDRPVLTDVSVSYGGIPVYDIYPEGLTDLFAGSQLFLVGRYSTGGSATGSVHGSVLGSDRDYTFPLDFPECARDANPFLPCLWAKAKVDSLVAEIARGGHDPAKVEEIQALAESCGIQTAYSSYGMGDPSGGTGGAPPVVPVPGSNGYYGTPESYRAGDLEEGGCQIPSGTGVPSGWSLLVAVGAILISRIRLWTPRR